MSVSTFFSSIADKAQSAINQTPLAGHISTSSGVASTNHPASQGGYRSLALESLQHQIRNLGQQYTSTSPVQRIITLEKGVALDCDALARDGQSQSKELYTWGQNEDPDLKDVTDRLAFLNFLHGSLSTSLSVKLDGARSPLKALRDAEAAIVPKRNIRTGLRNQIARMEHSQEKGIERRLSELKEQLSHAEKNDEPLEKEIELLKRKAIRESEQRKWEALREYGEKLALIAQAAAPIIGVLPTLPPAAANPYTSAEVTAAARASLQHALDDYKPGDVHLRLRTGSDLARSDTRSFGESHASELSIPEQQHPGLSVTPPIPEHGPITQSPPVNPDHGAFPAPTQLIPAATAGVVLQESRPSPAGSPSDGLYDSPVSKPESAEEEKKRLEREERERVLAAGNDVSNERPQAGSESAEEEKKRLEREERERVLAGGANAPRNASEGDGDELPPYQDFQQ